MFQQKASLVVSLLQILECLVFCGTTACLLCAVVINRGWDTNAIMGHVDPHSVTESACAGSHTQTFSTNLCG